MASELMGAKVEQVMIELNQITGLILAGGQARRMGGMDKGLVEICGESMCHRVVQLLAPQVHEVLINANRNHDRYRAFGVPVVEDYLSGYLGPLAGLASGMMSARTPWLITVPCDGPFLNDDYVARMAQQVDTNTNIVVAKDSERMQPTYMLVQTELVDHLKNFLDSGERKIDRWFVRHQYTTCDFSDSPDCFININSDEERLRAESRVEESDRG